MWNNRWVASKFFITFHRIFMGFLGSEVAVDAQGIRTSDLRSILENWPADKAKPKVLYTIPVSTLRFASAPFRQWVSSYLNSVRLQSCWCISKPRTSSRGATIGRRTQFLYPWGSVFILCNLVTSLNLDDRLDDPYFYLYYGDAPRVPSYFALERKLSAVGRVLRFDSLSKILSSGMRIGFVSGPEAILDAMDVHVRWYSSSQTHATMSPC